MSLPFVKTANDLITPHSAVRKGFIDLALVKTEKASAFVHRAGVFYTELKKLTKATEAFTLEEHRDEILAACGFSEKAVSQLTEDELNEASKKVLELIMKHAGATFAEEIIYRYLLTKGDSLGGSMRNYAGSEASKSISSRLLKELEEGEKTPYAEEKDGKIRKICWEDRILLFDVKSKIVGKNIDLVLLQSKVEDCDEQSLLQDPTSFIACGELKGGIDPAGADEHWKTARSALMRIKGSKLNPSPKLFFIAAAIEADMAKEIFEMIKEGELSYAANLTNDEQVDSLLSWLVSL